MAKHTPLYSAKRRIFLYVLADFISFYSFYLTNYP